MILTFENLLRVVLCPSLESTLEKIPCVIGVINIQGIIVLLKILYFIVASIYFMCLGDLMLSEYILQLLYFLLIYLFKLKDNYFTIL